MRSTRSLAAPTLLCLLCACSSPAPTTSPDPVPSTPSEPATPPHAEGTAAPSADATSAPPPDPTAPKRTAPKRAEPEARPPVRLPALTDINGALHELPDALARGEVVVLLVWWPSPSSQDLALRVAAAAADHGHALRFLGIVPAPHDGQGYDTLVRGTAADWELDLPSALDPGAELAQRLQGAPLEVPDSWGATGETAPWITVLGADGRVLWSAGEAPPNWEALYGRPRADGAGEEVEQAAQPADEVGDELAVPR